MYSLGLDIGSSSIKVAIVKTATGECVISLHEPSIEMEIHAPKKGWQNKIQQHGGNIPVKPLNDRYKKHRYNPKTFNL